MKYVLKFSGVMPLAESLQSNDVLEAEPIQNLTSKVLVQAKVNIEATASTSASEHDVPVKTRGRELWDIVVKKVLKSLGVSRQFRTLRDREDVEIRRRDLQQIGMLGQGAFAFVEKCIYLPQKRVVAVKRLRPDVMKNSEDLKDLMKEIALIRKLRHKNIIEYIGCGSWDTSSEAAVKSSVFLVEEFVNGGTLMKIVCRQMETDKELYRIEDAVRWLIGIAGGLKYLHQCQPMVIHRDLKLENIMLQGTDPHSSTAKLTDFGLSAVVNAHFKQRKLQTSTKVCGGGASDEANSERVQRRESTMIAENWTRSAKTHSVKKLRVAGPDEQLSGRTGTLMYMAPEVYKEEPYNDKADVYSFSIIAYELLHRYQMISVTDGSFEECLVYARRVARKGYRPPVDESIPQPLRQLITDCWRPEPSSRPSMSEVYDKLRECQSDQMGAMSMKSEDAWVPTTAAIVQEPKKQTVLASNEPLKTSSPAASPKMQPQEQPLHEPHQNAVSPPVFNNRAEGGGCCVVS
ncbi:hypothetical protein CEUSTIGMA_g2346.t1 [Chlamydomonas eustigma]|uniref:Protein kinase domain-containing protein n=1 Tax=Chlamydomonas eustigma TaxID=1157962 RepID=A0A250WWJ3_9CHLO|nr:hypothetical protein CEUSTIGMA_g2346.t1 [Chlamydomonas eustigma]|eukprot:GAX74900.1 hypothetical protein CEUSTIGMA_g2346.t1 [Chlamydomonas eustigma]